MANPSSSKHKIKDVAPKLFDMIETTVFADVWERKQLSKRDRSLITITALIAMRQTEQLRSHMEKALDNGVTPEEIGEVITHMALYAGFPAAISGGVVAEPLFRERGFIKTEA